MMRLLPIAAIALLLSLAAGCSENAGDDPERVLQIGGMTLTELELRADVLPDLTDEGSFCPALNGLSDDQAVAAFIQQLSFRPDQEIVPADERRFVEIAREECEDILAAPSPTSRSAAWLAVETDPAPDLPGVFVDLQTIYDATYVGDPSTAPHVTRDVDYIGDGNTNPPAGGPHWGSGACGRDPTDAPRFCGPAPWGIYRAPWKPETLVHNMEHGGVVLWYNTQDRAIIAELEDLVQSKLGACVILVMAPYPDMEDEHIALTSWARIDKFPVSEFTKERVEDYIDAHVDAHVRRFNPESF